MTKVLEKGEVAFTAAGTEYVLKPSLSAFSQLSRRYDDYTGLIRLIARNDVAAMAVVLRQGLGWNDTQAKALPKLIMDAGVTALIDPLTDFVFRLFNSGKSADEVMKEQAAEPEAGKAEAAKGGDDPLRGD